jgi:hypothetical protein
MSKYARARLRYLIINVPYRVLHRFERALSAIGWWLDKWCRPGRLFGWLRHQMAMHITISLAAASDAARRDMRRAQGIGGLSPLDYALKPPRKRRARP